MMLARILSALLALLPALAGLPPANDYDALRQRAEAAYAEKSFSRAHAVYADAARLTLTSEQKRWVDFRLADTAWRADNNDATAEAALEAVVRDGPHDRTWAEAQESLGDRAQARSPWDANSFRKHYTEALAWWGGSSDLALARERYLAIVWKLTRSAYGGGEEARLVPRDVAVNAVAIAATPADRAHARLLLATQLLEEGKAESVERAYELLDAAIAEGRTPSYDAALNKKAEQLDYVGAVIVNEDGTTSRRPDYIAALALYGRITSEFAPSESRYHFSAKSAIERITNPAVGVGVMSNFLPDSEQEFVLNWRNVRQIELTITAVDLPGDVEIDGTHRALNQLLPGKGREVRRWTFETHDDGTHKPGNERVHIAPRLPMGAYFVSAQAGQATGRSLLLVSDANIVVQSAGRTAQVYVSDVLTGAPIAGARVRASQLVRRESVDTTAETDARGLAAVARVPNSQGMLVVAAAGARQAYVLTDYYWWAGRSHDEDEWRIYAFTDRPAYRPGETVHWKMIARTRRGDEEWGTPVRREVHYEIHSPRDEVLAKGTAKLNEFGSFWADLPLTQAMALGSYRVNFDVNDERKGTAELFRLEEYKLPEMLVNVGTGTSPHRLGDTIEAAIDASYYFGGPVANATVEVTVHEQPFVRYWRDPFDWITPPPNEGGGREVKKETLHTDANGRAVVHIETPRDGNARTYGINACVTDSSRRQVCSAGEVRVMQQRYAVDARPRHYIHLPGDPVPVDFRALDANDKPVQTTGSVTVTRRRWRDGSYRDEEVVTTTRVTTNAEGKAEFTFTPQRDGYYAVQWRSEDADPGRATKARDVVKAETAVFVSRESTADIGYHTGGLQIILDAETLHPGDVAPVLIATPASGRWVVVTASGEGPFETHVLHLDGTVKLVPMKIDRRHIPDFTITAFSVFDRRLSTETKNVPVPPVDRFLTVDVKADRAEYEPRQEGAVTVTTRDASGRPVPAEVALAVADESVTAIQEDLAGDPRQFFYGEARNAPVSVNGSLLAQRYARLVAGPEGRLVTEEELKKKENPCETAAAARDEEGGVEGGLVGGVVGGAPGFAFDAVTEAVPPAPIAPPPPPGAVAERITVTANAPKVMAQALKKADVMSPGKIEVVVRSDFRSTALWRPDVVTDANGTATVRVPYPEALTTWRTTARAATSDARFGIATATARTSLPLLVRLEAPRFLVVGDRSTVSAVVNNNGAESVRVAATLDASGVTVASGPSANAIDVPAHGEARVDWIVEATAPGSAKLRVSGRGPSRGDAMEKSIEVYEHGIDKLVARSGKLRGAEAIVRLDLPHARRDTALTVQVAPTLTAAMIDALPYLLDYPYGCTEQTMSRFLPAAIVARAIEKTGAVPQPLENLGEIVKQSTARLYDFQHSDGGWGWWKEGYSDTFMTAYVVWGFAVARSGGIDVDERAVSRGAAWLDEQLVQFQDRPNDLAWMLHALAAWRHAAGTAAETAAFRKAYEKREELSPYSRALLALAAHDFGKTEEAHVLVRNLENGEKIDRPSGASAEAMATAHWGADGFWWHWYEGPVESTAFALQALVAIDPQNELVEPVMNWLAKNRRGARWNNTRDTAISILALTDYVKASGEVAGDVAYEVTVNGRVIASKTITAAEALRTPNRFTVEPGLVADANEIRIRRTGGRPDAPLYFAAEGRFVSLEEPVTAASNEIAVKRTYLRLVPRPTLLQGVEYDRVPLRDGDTVVSGDRIETVVTIESKNDYEYLLFEDLKPAGLEAVALRSGEPLYASAAGGEARGTIWVYQELRDRKVALFVDHMPQGTWSIRYTLRAETPGSFHALPVVGGAMYVPEIHGNGDEVRVKVAEAKPR